MPGGQCKQGRAGEGAGPSTDAFSAEPDRTPLGLFGKLPVDVFCAILDMDPGARSKLFGCSKELAKLVAHHSALHLKLGVRSRQSAGAWVGVRSILQWLPALELELEGPEERYNPQTYTYEPAPGAQVLCEQALCGLLGITPDQPRGVPGLRFPGVKTVSCYNLRLPTLAPAALAAACPNTSTYILRWVTLTTTASTSGPTAQPSSGSMPDWLEDGTWASVVSLRCLHMKLESGSSPTPRRLKTMLPSLTQLELCAPLGFILRRYTQEEQVLASACLAAWAPQLTHLTADPQVFEGSSVAASLEACQVLQLLHIKRGTPNANTSSFRQALHSLARPFVARYNADGWRRDAIQALFSAPHCTEVVLESFRAADDCSDCQCIPRSVMFSMNSLSLGSAACLPAHSLLEALLWRPELVNGKAPFQVALWIYHIDADLLMNTSALDSASSCIQRVRKLAARGGLAVELDKSTVLVYDQAAAGQSLLELLQAARACVHLRGPVPRVDVTCIGADLSTAMLAELAATHEPTGGIRQLAMRQCAATTTNNLPGLFALFPRLDALILAPTRGYSEEQQQEGIAGWVGLAAARARTWLAVCTAQGGAPRPPLRLAVVDWFCHRERVHQVCVTLARADLPQGVQLTVCKALWANTSVLCMVIAKQEGGAGAAARVVVGDDLGELV